MSQPDIQFNRKRIGAALFLFALLCVFYTVLRTYIYPPSRNTVSWSNNNFYVLDLSIPADLEFCGEKIPSNNFEIRDDLKKEFFNSAYWKANSLALFRKAQRWFPYIEPILEQERVPNDFKYVAVIESHLSNITSSAGASGFWQLLPASARNYGLRVDADVDERLHVEKATRAACKHFKDGYAVFGNWTLAAAAYNRGIGGIQAALKKQKTDNYFDLLLNRETGSFVYRILAYKTLFSSPGHFGIRKKKWTYFPKVPVVAYKIDSSVTHLSALAVHLGVDVHRLRDFNPWLISGSLPNPDKQTYEIRLPKYPDRDYSAWIADLHGGAALTPARVEPIAPAIKPAQDSAAVSTPNIVAEPRVIRHVLKGDENLKAVAAKYGVSEEDLQKCNNLPGGKAAKGTTLTIYAAPVKKTP